MLVPLTHATAADSIERDDGDGENVCCTNRRAIAPVRKRLKASAAKVQTPTAMRCSNNHRARAAAGRRPVQLDLLPFSAHA